MRGAVLEPEEAVEETSDVTNWQWIGDQLQPVHQMGITLWETERVTWFTTTGTTSTTTSSCTWYHGTTTSTTGVETKKDKAKAKPKAEAKAVAKPKKTEINVTVVHAQPQLKETVVNGTFLVLGQRRPAGT